MTQTPTSDRIAALRAAYQAERAAARAPVPVPVTAPPDLLPTDLQSDLEALRAAGIEFTILRIAPTPPPSPAREVGADEVAGLDARDPRRALHLYQRAFARLGRPVPAAIVCNLRAAARDERARRLRFAAR